MTTKKNPRRFYVYQLRLKNSEYPFYYGKGTGHRYLDHFKPGRLKADASYKGRTIRKAYSEGIEVLSEIRVANLTKREALDLEVELIAIWGRKHADEDGVLTNITPGGDGPTGPKSESHKEAIRKSLTGKSKSAEHKRKLSEATAGVSKTSANQILGAKSQKEKMSLRNILAKSPWFDLSYPPKVENRLRSILSCYLEKRILIPSNPRRDRERLVRHLFKGYYESCTNVLESFGFEVPN